MVCNDNVRRVSGVSGAVSLNSWRFSATFLPAVVEGGITGVEEELEEDDDEIDE